MNVDQQFEIKSVIKEIGRGKNHARDLDQTTAYQLYRAMLAGEVDALSLGAILIALRIKGEGEEELLGFYQAVTETLPQWPLPAGKMPIIIPSYNGARRQANLTPLLAMLLHRCQCTVFVHGIHNDPSRVTTADIFAALGIEKYTQWATAYQSLSTGQLTFMTIDDLSPSLAQQLDLRWQLNLRNSAHTLAKLITPFAGQGGLRLSSVSHPEYVPRVSRFFHQLGASALLINGCEGEVYANPQRAPIIYHLDPQLSQAEALTEKDNDSDVRLAEDKSVSSTVRYIQQVLEGQLPVPRALRKQIACCFIATQRVTTLDEGLNLLAEYGY